MTSDDGAVSAEFAVALPAVIVVLAAALGAVVAVGHLAGLERSAAVVVRAAARGEPEQTVAAAGGRAEADWDRRDGLVCVTLADRVRLVAFDIPLRATSCTLDGGR